MAAKIVTLVGFTVAVLILLYSLADNPPRVEAVKASEATLHETQWAERIAAALSRDLNERVVTEYRFADKSRADLMLSRWAVEVDWAPKWAEGVGQALYYSAQSNKPPVVLLLIKDQQKEAIFVRRLRDATKTVTPKVTIWLFDINTCVLNCGDEREVKVH